MRDSLSGVVMTEKFNYFMNRTEKDIDELKESHARLHEKVDTLLKFKWQIVGGGVFISFIITVLMQAAVIILKLK